MMDAAIDLNHVANLDVRSIDYESPGFGTCLRYGDIPDTPTIATRYAGLADVAREICDRQIRERTTTLRAQTQLAVRNGHGCECADGHRKPKPARDATGGRIRHSETNGFHMVHTIRRGRATRTCQQLCIAAGCHRNVTTPSYD